MACISSTGEITEMARKFLTAMTHNVSLQELSDQSGTPLYRIRSSARELMQAGLIQQKDQQFVVTAAGFAALSASGSTSTPEPPK